jgi:HEAT repeat protein
MPLIRKGPGSEAPPPPPDFEQAYASLRSEQIDERWRAARALAAFPQAAAVLGRAVGSEPEARVREAMFTSLARIGTLDSLKALAPHIRSDDAAHRTGAMDALKAIPEGLPTVMAELLKDPDADVRLLACDLARELPGAEATAILSAVLDTDAEVNVCAAAVDVIADIGSPEALPSLRRCAERFPDEPFLAFAIKIAGDRIGAQAPPRG